VARAHAKVAIFILLRAPNGVRKNRSPSSPQNEIAFVRRIAIDEIDRLIRKVVAWPVNVIAVEQRVGLRRAASRKMKCR
jgi:hypothetical protein